MFTCTSAIWLPDLHSFCLNVLSRKQAETPNPKCYSSNMAA